MADGKSKKIILFSVIGGVVVIVLALGLWFMSHGTLKIKMNVAADTLIVTDSDKDVVATITGQNEATVKFLSSGTYTIDIKAAGYKTEKKEVEVGWISSVSESFVLVADSATIKAEFADAEAALMYQWQGKFLKSEMVLAISQAGGGNASGYNQTGGKQTELNGTYQKNGENYNVTLNELGNSAENGQFVFTVNNSTGMAEGYWESKDKNTKVPFKFQKGDGKAKPQNSKVKNQTNTSEPSEYMGLVILSAKYGTAGKFYDVTHSLSNKIRNGKLFVNVSNASFGDPDRGHPKSLTLKYKYGGQVYNRSYREGMNVNIP
ncbi:MAG: DUF3395 domain-containing protein [Bacteroidota bacterium]